MIKGRKDRVYFHNYNRYIQISNWIIEDNPNFIRTVKRLIVVDTIEKAFNYFFNELIYNINDSTLSYLIIENCSKVNRIDKDKKTEVFSRLFKILFGKYVSTQAKEKVKKVTKKVKEKEIKKIKDYRKMVTYRNKKVELCFVIVNKTYQLRARDDKGKFYKIPKKEADKFR